MSISQEPVVSSVSRRAAAFRIEDHPLLLRQRAQVGVRKEIGDGLGWLTVTVDLHPDRCHKIPAQNSFQLWNHDSDRNRTKNAGVRDAEAGAKLGAGDGI